VDKKYKKALLIMCLVLLVFFSIKRFFFPLSFIFFIDMTFREMNRFSLVISIYFINRIGYEPSLITSLNN